MADDIVTGLQEEANRLRHEPKFVVVSPSLHEEAADEIERLREELKTEQTMVMLGQVEIQRLQEAGDWLWEAMSRHDNTRECPQCQDMINMWKEVRRGDR